MSYILRKCLRLSTVKPVYNGLPWGITKWPLLTGGRCSVYIKLMLLNMLQSLLKLSDTRHDRQKYHCPTHESQLQVSHKHNL